MATTNKGVQYVCPMDSDIITDEPSRCSKCGMDLEPVYLEIDLERIEKIQKRELKTALIQLAIGFGLAFVTFGLALTANFAEVDNFTKTFLHYLQLALSFVVVGYFGRPILTAGVRSVINRSLNMFTLLSLGIVVVWLYSLVVLLFFPDLPVYFEVAAWIVVLSTAGQYIEFRARGVTGNAILRLLSLAPDVATLVKDGQFSEVPVAELQVGDTVLIKPGARVPADGVVVKGDSRMDESMLTGEPLKVHKVVGSGVFGGTVNTTGSLEVQLKQVGADTVLHRIVRAVEEARFTNAPIQRLVDRVSAYFVPTVLVLASITFILWGVFGGDERWQLAILNSVAVLIIACPCALGLATPMSLTVGMGKGASFGVLFRDATALETLSRVNTLVIDKTGTLTKGEPKLIELITTSDVTESELLARVASLEQYSEHPLAEALVGSARERKLKLQDATNFKTVVGLGVEGDVGGERIYVGSVGYMESVGIKATELSKYDDRTYTTVFVGRKGQLLGVFKIGDELKENAAEVLRVIREGGVEVVIATGDGSLASDRIAAELGVTEVHRGMTPIEKLELIKSKRAEGGLVAMAGDGINDAPALAQATVGIAMGDGTDIAIESADVVVIGGDLNGIRRALTLSRATMSNIRAGLLFAFVYNVALIPIAAGVFFPLTGIVFSPAYATIAMSLSSVSVILNALRLRRLRG